MIKTFFHWLFANKDSRKHFVAETLFEKANRYFGRNAIKANKLYNAFIERYQSDTDPIIRKKVSSARYNNAIIIGKMEGFYTTHLLPHIVGPAWGDRFSTDFHINRLREDHTTHLPHLANKQWIEDILEDSLNRYPLQSVNNVKGDIREREVFLLDMDRENAAIEQSWSMQYWMALSLFQMFLLIHENDTDQDIMKMIGGAYIHAGILLSRLKDKEAYCIWQYYAKKYDSKKLLNRLTKELDKSGMNIFEGKLSDFIRTKLEVIGKEFLPSID